MKKVTLEEFNAMDFRQKWNFIYKNPGAELVMFRQDEKKKMVLFDCGAFYAETIANFKSTEISVIEGFTYQDPRVDLYLDYMKDFVSKLDDD